MQKPKELQMSSRPTWRVGDLFLGANRSAIMGILNITPDSFFDGGQYQSIDLAMSKAEKMVFDGVDIFDVGGESSRPGAEKVSLSEELDRVVVLVEALTSRFDIPVSIDTTKAGVAKEALKNGALIVNDISALKADPLMFDVVTSHKCSVVLNHMQGSPGDMQKDPTYQNVVSDVKQDLLEVAESLLTTGLKPNQICLDPGIGFGKTHQNNCDLMWNVSSILELGMPVLMGMSRKSFIARIPGLESSDRLIPSVAAAVISSLAGASVLRVHDVKETREALELLEGLRN